MLVHWPLLRDLIIWTLSLTGMALLSAITPIIPLAMKYAPLLLVLLIHPSLSSQCLTRLKSLDMKCEYIISLLPSVKLRLRFAKLAPDTIFQFLMQWGSPAVAYLVVISRCTVTTICAEEWLITRHVKLPVARWEHIIIVLLSLNSKSY